MHGERTVVVVHFIITVMNAAQRFSREHLIRRAWLFVIIASLLALVAEADTASDCAANVQVAPIAEEVLTQLVAVSVLLLKLDLLGTAHDTPWLPLQVFSELSSGCTYGMAKATASMSMGKIRESVQRLCGPLRLSL